LNAAVTLAAAVIVRLQVPAPEQLPLQPPKKYLLPAVAVRVICVFFVKLAVQVVGQLIPGGVLDTVPAPVAGAATVNWYDGGGGGCEFNPVPPPQPARSRVDRAHSDILQNASRDSMAGCSPERLRTLDESKH
jgi:hypothetical protein